MSEQAPMPGEFVYEQIAQVREITEYGVAFDELVSGTASLPTEGARFDAVIEGTMSGPKLNGVVKGVDCLHVRADGRVEIHYHAEITTEDEKKIALEADGVLALGAGVVGCQTAEQRGANDGRSRIRLAKHAPDHLGAPEPSTSQNVKSASAHTPSDVR